MTMYFVTVPVLDGATNFLIVAANSKAEVEMVLQRNQVAGRSAAEILDGAAAEQAFMRQYPDCATLTT